MGAWNYYFIAKLFLYFGHYIGFHVPANLAFALFLAIPAKRPWLKLLRQVIAAPAGVALFYYDTWLPPFSRVVSQASLLKGFDAVYMMELAGRFINPAVVAALALLYAVYFFARKRLRVSTFVFIAILAPLLPLPEKSPDAGIAAVSSGTAGNQPSPGSPGTSAAKPPEPVTDEKLTASLDSFYKNEAARAVSFVPPEKSDAPFDIIFLHVCSLSWDDLDFVKERDNPLFKRFDIVFTDFNSAASYSGPAAIRVLRGSCGQQKHSALYEPPPPQCLTFDNLRQAGFEPQMAMDHDGHFGDFLAEVCKYGGLDLTPFGETRGMPTYLQSFDGTPVYDDYTMLSKWWEKRLKTPAARVVLYYNSISLHDGNRYSGSRSGNSMEIYHPRLTRLLDGIDRFLAQLSASGRRAVVVFIPEHGASIRGDKIQIAGMREIPSPRISIVPVGVKLIGAAGNAGAGPLIVSKPSSYLALSQLLSEFVGKTPFGGSSLDLGEYVRDLPTTEFVAENDDVVVMRRGNRYFMRTWDTGWIEYDPSE